MSNLLGWMRPRVRQEDVEATLDVLEQDIPEGFEIEDVGQYEHTRCPNCQPISASRSSTKESR
jgi:hypothetical protein